MLSLRRRWVLASLGLASLQFTGCQTLPDIPEGCGNRIAELDKGEDCDEEGAGCGQPGQPNACLYLCPGSETKCPSEYVCGSDHVCRRPAYQWGAPKTLSTGIAEQVSIADFDGDGIGDLAAVVPPTIEVSYFDESGGVTSSPSITVPNAAPAFGYLGAATEGGAPIAGFTADVSDALGVVLGSETGQLAPVAYSSVTFSADTCRVAALRGPPAKPDQVGPVAPLPSFNVFIVASMKGVFFPAMLSPGQPDPGPTLVGTLPQAGVTSLAGQPVVAEFLDQTHAGPCDEAALAFEGAKSVLWMPVCDASGGKLGATNVATAIPLPAELSVCTGCQPLHAFDANGDGLLDLVISATSGAGNKGALLVAYSRGDGTFGSDPKTGKPLTDEAVVYSRYDTLFQPGASPLPLAVGDLNHDGLLDYVSQYGVWFGVDNSGGEACGSPIASPVCHVSPSFLSTEHDYTSAAIADLNHDGNPDVVLGVSRASGITVLMGTGGYALDPFPVVTSGGVGGFSVGDFNGDGIDDVAYVVPGDVDGSTPRSTDSLGVFYGSASGGPSASLDLGTITGIGQITTVDNALASYDAASDLWVTSSPADGTISFSLYPGNGTGALQSPYYFLEGGANVPVASAIGKLFDHDHNDVAVLAASSADKAVVAFLPLKGAADVDPTFFSSMGYAPSLSVPAGYLEAAGQANAVATADLGLGASGAAGRSQVVVVSSVRLDRLEDTPTMKKGASKMLVMGLGAGGAVENVTPGTCDNGGATPDAWICLPGDFAIPALGAARLGGQVLVTDVDGDGKDDVVLVSARSGLLVLYEGKVTGGSKAPLAIPIEKLGGATEGTDVQELAIGVAPLSLGGTSGTSLLVVRNDGSTIVTPDGSGGAETRALTSDQGPIGGVAVAVGDINGDGIPDIVMAQHQAPPRLLLGQARLPGGGLPVTTVEVAAVVAGVGR